MKILFVDDEIDRQLYYVTTHKLDKVDFATNYNETIKALETSSRFDLIDLDYELHDFSAGREHEKTGLHIVRYIFHDLPPDKIPLMAVCHSLNCVRRRSMAKLLKEGGIPTLDIPFGGESERTLRSF